jgi:predicted GIY-YIG superfamily endonuclease
MSAVYLYHFEQPLGNERHQAQHYVGFAVNLKARDFMHQRGRGSHFTRAAVARGIAFRLARVWHGATREIERRIKRSGRSFADFCPVCAGEAAMRRGRAFGESVAIDDPNVIEGVGASIAIDEWPAAPASVSARADRYELGVRRAWRSAAGAFAAEQTIARRAALGLDETTWDDGLI